MQKESEWRDERGGEVCWSSRCRVRVDFQKQDGVEANEVKEGTMRGKIMGQQDSQWQFTQLKCLKDLGQSEVLCLLVTVLFTVVILGPDDESSIFSRLVRLVLLCS